jgi:hypothetical protein
MKLASVALAIACAFILSCSSVPSDLSEDQSEALLTSHPVGNGTITMWSGSAGLNKFCHPVYMNGAGAHSQSPNFNAGGKGLVPWFGGTVSHEDNNGSQFAAAIPNNGKGTTNAGAMSATYECHNYADFGGSGWTGQSGVVSLNWSVPPSLQAVSGSQPLWGYNSACWLDGAGHMSVSSEKASLELESRPSDPTGLAWRLDANGFAALSASARCAYYGRQLSVSSWHTATTGSPSQLSSVTYATGTCFVITIEGSMDDGFANFRHDMSGNRWRLDVGGTVSKARGYCVAY